MNRFASLPKALPWLLISAALIGVTYFVFNPDAPVDELAREQASAVTVAVNGLPKQHAEVGTPPDTKWISERVIELPEDGGMWHTVLILDNSLESKRVADEFNKNPRLQSLTTQTKFYQYSPDHWWVQRHRNGYRYPLVLVQRPSIETGGTNDFVRVYESWGQDVPLNGDLLADDIAKMIARPCPNPQPAPQPAPVTPPNNVPLVPTLTPQDTEPPADQSSWQWWMYAIIAAGGLLGGYRGVKN